MTSDDRASGGITIAIAIGAFLVATIAMVAVVVDRPSRSSSGGGSEATQTLSMELSEFAISPDTVHAEAGPVTLSVSNTGSMAHNISIPDLGVKSADLGAGESEDLDLVDVAAGVYKVICEIAGHEESGMVGTLIVGEATGEDMDHGSGSNAVQEEFDNAQMEADMTAGVEKFLEFAEKYASGEVKAGNQPLEPTVLADGTKEFELTVAITEWQVSPGKVVEAWTYNGMVPGPRLHVDPGDKVRVVVNNELPISTDVHMHGLDVPFAMDGVAPITQDFIRPGDSFVYEFTADSQPKLGMYHAHMHGQEAIVNGLFAIFEIGHVALPVGRSINGIDVPADLDPATIRVVDMVLNDAGVIGLSLNGKAFPETEPIVANAGEWLRIDFYNEGLQGHPMHLHRQSQLVIAKDGYPLAEPYRMDTLWVSPGERYSVLVRVDEAGIWAFHCHIVPHAEDEHGLMGMVTAMVVE